MKTGFSVGEIKNKVWDSSTEGKESFEGSYFTQNLMTAYGAAGAAKRKFGGSYAFIEVQIETRTSLYDEDVIPKMVDVVKMAWNKYNRDKNGQGYLLTPHSAQALLDSMEKPDSEKHSYEMKSSDIEEYLETVITVWIEGHFAYNEKVAEKELNPAFREALTPLLKEQAIEALKLNAREDIQASSMTHWVGHYRDLTKQIVSKLRGLSARVRSNYANHIRVDTPIGFSGANKITAIIVQCAEYPYAEVASEAGIPRLVAVYGTPSEVFLKAYRERVGEDPSWVRGTFKDAEDFTQKAKSLYKDQNPDKKSENMDSLFPRMGEAFLTFSDGAQWLTSKNRGLTVFTLRMPKKEVFSSRVVVQVDKYGKIRSVSDPVQVGHRKYLIALLIHDSITGFHEDYDSNFSLKSLGHEGKTLVKNHSKFQG